LQLEIGGREGLEQLDSPAWQVEIFLPGNVLPIQKRRSSLPPTASISFGISDVLQDGSVGQIPNGCSRSQGISEVRLRDTLPVLGTKRKEAPSVALVTSSDMRTYSPSCYATLGTELGFFTMIV